jgi:hypothetical protein
MISRPIKKSNSGLVELLKLENEDFAKFTSEHSQTKLKGRDRPQLSCLVEVQFRRGSRQLQREFVP